MKKKTSFLAFLLAALALTAVFGFTSHGSEVSHTEIVLTGKTTFASSVEKADNTHSNIVDGNTSKKWVAAGAVYPSYVGIDLGSIYDVTKVELDFFGEANTRSYTYNVSYSLYGENYTPFSGASNTCDSGILTQVRSHEVSGTARFVKIEYTACNQSRGTLCLRSCTSTAHLRKRLSRVWK